jgi:hypothetical protein
VYWSLILGLAAVLAGCAAPPPYDEEAPGLPVEEGTWIGYGDVSQGEPFIVTCSTGKIPIIFSVSQGKATSLLPKTTLWYFETKLKSNGGMKFSYKKAGKEERLGVRTVPIKLKGSLSGSKGGGRTYFGDCEGRWEVRRSLEAGKSENSVFFVAADWVLRFKGGGAVERIDTGEYTAFSGLDVLGEFLAVHVLAKGERRTDVYHCPDSADCVTVGRVPGVHTQFGSANLTKTRGLGLDIRDNRLGVTSQGSVVRELDPAPGMKLTGCEASQDFFLIRAGEIPEGGVTILYHLSASDGSTWPRRKGTKRLCRTETGWQSG